ATARARLAVVRRRATDAVSGGAARVSYLVVAVGLVAFALFADVASSDRTDAIAVAKACAEAREAKALEADLSDTACAARPAETDKPPADARQAPFDEVRAALMIRLSELLDSCVA